MRIGTLWMGLICSLVILGFSVSEAQDTPASSPGSVEEIAEDMLEMTGEESVFLGPHTDNKATKERFTPDPTGKNPFVAAWWKVIKPLNLDLKTFDTDDTDLNLGFAYSWAKDFEIDDLSLFEGLGAADISFSSRGNVAFDEDANPLDFLEHRVSVDLYQTWGGTVGAVVPAEAQEEYRQLGSDAADIETEDELERFERERVSPFLRKYMRDQLYLEFALSAGLESNQGFTAEQLIFGAHLLGEFKAWTPDSVGTKLNFFEYPFVIVRFLTGYSDTPEVPGYTWPTVLVGFDLVDPQDGDPRRAVGDGSEFGRFRTEVSFRTPVAKIKDEEVFFDLNYRFYYEVDADRAVRSADLHEFDLVSIALESASGFFASYSAGRLPFDTKDDAIYELGWKLNF